jgi:ribose/xylose/arabinose/galactoside ABC-type transport system permease subunit
MDTAKRITVRARSAIFGMQEVSLVLVVLFLGAILTFFGGTVKVPKLQVNERGERQRVFDVVNGERVPVFEEKNKFLNAANLTQLAKDTSFIGIMAVGATFIIIAGQIDLSVGAIYALASVLGAIVFRAFGPNGALANAPPNEALLLGMLTCLLVGFMAGVLNGAMVVALKVHPFIITLGTMAIYRGEAFVITSGQSIGDFPEAFRYLIRWETGDGLSLVPLGVMLAVVVIATFYLTFLVPGRHIYAVGGNEQAAQFSGIRVKKVKLKVFIFSGLTAGVAALLAIGYYGSATSGDGQGYELDVIAAAVVGGASLSGGRGSALGALLGALIIKMIDNGIVILGIDQNYSRIIIGAAVILAVVLDQFGGWWARRRMAREA